MNQRGNLISLIKFLVKLILKKYLNKISLKLQIDLITKTNSLFNKKRI